MVSKTGAMVGEQNPRITLLQDVPHPTADRPLVAITLDCF